MSARSKITGLGQTIWVFMLRRNLYLGAFFSPTPWTLYFPCSDAMYSFKWSVLLLSNEWPQALFADCQQFPERSHQPRCSCARVSRVSSLTLPTVTVYGLYSLIDELQLERSHSQNTTVEACTLKYSNTILMTEPGTAWRFCLPALCLKTGLGKFALLSGNVSWSLLGCFWRAAAPPLPPQP